MDAKTYLLLAVLFIVVAAATRTLSPPGQGINPHTISVPVFADEYIVKTTIVNGETATVYYTSRNPTRGTLMTVTLYPEGAATTRTVYWYSDGKWYYFSGGILMSTDSFPTPGTMTLDMRLENNVLVLYSNGTTYTPTGTLEDKISSFTIVTDGTTIEYTLLRAKYAPLS